MKMENLQVKNIGFKNIIKRYKTTIDKLRVANGYFEDLYPLKSLNYEN